MMPSSGGKATGGSGTGGGGGFKNRRGSGQVQKWEWVEYSNSARVDQGKQKFSRWNKVGLELVDYPYARFNISMDALEYTDQEYASSLGDPDWTRMESDRLVALCRRFDLRWPVISDRWQQQAAAAIRTAASGIGGVRLRTVQQLQHRYYTMAQRVLLCGSATRAAHLREATPLARGGTAGGARTVGS